MISKWASVWGAPPNCYHGASCPSPHPSIRLDDNPCVQNLSSQVHRGLKEACPLAVTWVPSHSPAPTLSHLQLIKGHIPSVYFTAQAQEVLFTVGAFRVPLNATIAALSSRMPLNSTAFSFSALCAMEAD